MEEKVNLEKRIENLEIQIKFLKKALISVTFLVLVFLLFELAYPRIKTDNLKSNDEIEKSFSKLNEEVKVLANEIKTLQQRRPNYQDIQNWDNNSDKISILIEPNILSPWPVWDSRAGIWFEDSKGNGKYLRNYYLSKFTKLVDEAIKKGIYSQYSKIPDGFIRISIYLDEEKPGKMILLNLKEQEIIFRNQRFKIRAEDFQAILDLLEEGGAKP